MKQLIKLAAAAAIGAIASGTIVYAQAATTEPPKARVALSERHLGSRSLCSNGWPAKTAPRRRPDCLRDSCMSIPTATVGIIWQLTRLRPPPKTRLSTPRQRRWAWQLGRLHRWSSESISRCIPTHSSSARLHRNDISRWRDNRQMRRPLGCAAAGRPRYRFRTLVLMAGQHLRSGLPELRPNGR